MHQRKGKGGRPALIINESKYHIKNLTNTVILIPWGVEITWALITPKQLSSSSIVRKIAVASVYCKPHSVKKTALLDHIAESYHFLCSKYPSGLYFILAGDTNELKLNPILNLSPNFKQVVSSPTRMDPPKMLDPIITTLSKYYQSPVCLPPLDNDPDKDGSPADHLIVYMEPVNNFNNNPARKTKIVKYRPLPRSGIEAMGKWIVQEKWNTVTDAETANEKALNLQHLLLEKLEQFLPQKVVKFTSEDQPWVTAELKSISRKKKREYSKNRKSSKWKSLNNKFLEACKKAKKDYYTNIVEDLKESKPGQWYSKLKRMSSYNEQKSEEVSVEEINHLSNQQQSEKIADSFSRISNEYEQIEESDINLESATNLNPAPVLEAYQVYEYLRKINIKSSTVKDDIPAKIIKEFSAELAMPLSDVINSIVGQGQYPEIWKIEMVSPMAKVFPPQTVEELRKISGLKNFSKITEKIIGDWMISDMSEKRDISQYGNEKKISVNHYLIRMINEILSNVDRNSINEKFAVFCTMVDWEKAFDRQCPVLGVKSFIQNGVRRELIPMLISYFQNRRMIVKWKGTESSERILNGGGPQGALWGILEYLSQSNSNTDYISNNRKFKFIDDLSILEIINLISIGLSSYNVKHHVPSDVPANGYYLEPENMKTQQFMRNISEWTNENKMRLNTRKTKAMVFNFTNDYQFSSRVQLDNEVVEIVKEARLLGVIINDKLTWDPNTDYIVKRANSRMRLIHKLVEFNVPSEDLLNIYFLYIRSILEQSCQVWHSRLTLENITDLERIQKTACKIILQENYSSYSEALDLLNIESLYDRRSHLCLKFARNCLKSNLSKDIFPPSKNDHHQSKEKFHVNMAFTGRLKKSTIPYMQRLLNSEGV